jgi:hypothetical protein
MPSLSAILRWTLRVLALLVAGDALVLGLFHLDDLYTAHYVPGIWMALAKYVNSGMLYPPLQEAGFYGGTRYTPLFFTLTAGLARVAPDYLVAAKLAALLSMVVLVGGVAAAIRQMSGRWQEVPLAALLLAIPQGLNAVLMPLADALSAGLSVWGLVVLGAQPTRHRLVWSALLFVLAILTKFSSLAGPAAAFGFLLLRDRKLCGRLVLACLVLGLLALGLIEFLSQDRFLVNLRALGGGGSDWSSALSAPAVMFGAIGRSGGFKVVLPVLAAALVVRAGNHRWTLWDWYFLTAVLSTLVIYTSRGTAENHLLEMEAAGVLLLARIVSSPTVATGLERLLQPLLCAAALIVLLLGVYPHRVVWGHSEADGVISKRQVEDAIPPDARLLAEAPTIPVLRDQRPVVLDAFNFEILARTGKIDDDALAERIRRKEFDVLILLARIDQPRESLCPESHFGPRVTDAMLQSYRFDRKLGAYVLFVPQ